MVSRRDVAIYGIVRDTAILPRKAGSNGKLSRPSKKRRPWGGKKYTFLFFAFGKSNCSFVDSLKNRELKLPVLSFCNKTIHVQGEISDHANFILPSPTHTYRLRCDCPMRSRE